MIIEFNGELTGNSKKFILKQQRNVQIIAAIIVSLLFVPLIVIATFSWNPLAALFFILIGVLVVALVLPPNKNNQKLFMPKKIFVDTDEGTVVHICEKMERFHMLETVKKVIDYGEWYYLVFKYSDRDLYFVCQKSLLSQGSIEEFEAIFDGRMERRF